MFARYLRSSGQRLLLAQIGSASPLFYAPQRTAFHSAAIPALLEVPDIDTRPDRQAIYDFAALFYIPALKPFTGNVRCSRVNSLKRNGMVNG
jgi:hypothetical protein